MLHRLVILPDGVQHRLGVKLGAEDDHAKFLPLDAFDNLCCIEQIVVVEIEKLSWVCHHRFADQQVEHCFLAKGGAIGGADIVEDLLACCVIVGREQVPQLRVTHRVVVLERGTIAFDQHVSHAERPGQWAEDGAGGGHMKHARSLHQVE